jgi:hypothetical protein
VLAAFLVNIIAITFAAIAKNKDSAWLKAAFIVVFIFLAIRYGYGNDYMGYLKYFLDVNKYVYGFSDYIKNITYVEAYSGIRDVEIGWAILCKISQPIGFFAMVASISGLYCYIHYKLINEYVPPLYYWFAVTIFVFDPKYVLIQASAMRQSIAVIIVIMSFYFLKNRRFFSYGIGIYISSLFHKSSIVNLPVYLLTLKNRPPKIIHIVMVVMSYLVAVSMTMYLSQLLNIFLAKYFEDYSIYAFRIGKLNSGISLIYFLVIITIILYHSMTDKGDILLLNKIAVISLFISAMGTVNVMVGRIGFYYVFALLVSVPYVVSKIDDKVLKAGVMITYILYVVFMWYSHFYSPIWYDAYYEYHTIFESFKIY